MVSSFPIPEGTPIYDSRGSLIGSAKEMVFELPEGGEIVPYDQSVDPLRTCPRDNTDISDDGMSGIVMVCGTCRHGTPMTDKWHNGKIDCGVDGYRLLCINDYANTCEKWEEKK